VYFLCYHSIDIWHEAGASNSIFWPKKSKGEDLFAPFHQDWNNNNNNNNNNNKMICRPNNKSPPPMNTEIFSMGACVRVDPSLSSQGGIGFVTSVHTEERKVDVNYNENSIGIINSSPFVTEARIHLHVYAPSDDAGTIWSGRRHIEFSGGTSNALTPSPKASSLSSNRKRKKKRNRPKNLRCSQEIKIVVTIGRTTSSTKTSKWREGE
jgi:hypothetical protein